MVRRLIKVTTTSGVALVALIACAAPAWAHVTVESTTTVKDADATLTFQVPNEEDNATVTKLVVQFPQNPPFPDASVQPVAGWTIDVATTKLTTPITTNDGDTVDSSIKTITWTASPAAAIKPGQFQQFKVAVGLPNATGALSFPAIQTYSDGTVVSWTDQTVAGAPEPEHPAPVLTLTAGSETGQSSAPATTTSKSSDDAPRPIPTRFAPRWSKAPV